MQLIRKPFGCLALLALALSPITTLGADLRYKFEALDLPDPLGYPVAILNSGKILVGGSGGTAALVDDDKDRKIKLITIPDTFSPSVNGINEKETIVGWASTEDFSSSFGFIKKKSGKTTILNTPGYSLSAYGINDRGVVVGAAGSEDGLSFPGFILDGKKAKFFAAPGADSTELRGINDSGTAVGLYYAFASGFEVKGFILDGSKYKPLNIPDAVFSTAMGINQRGEVVGSYAKEFGDAHGFVYYRGELTTVDYPFSEEEAPAVSFPPEPFDFGDGRAGTVTYTRFGSSTEITGINDSGNIVGYAGVSYQPVAECGGCSVSPFEFEIRSVFAKFTAERRGGHK